MIKKSEVDKKYEAAGDHNKNTLVNNCKEFYTSYYYDVVEYHIIL